MSNPELTDLGRLIRYWYFALTTLASNGYGDFYAKATVEKVVLKLTMTRYWYCRKLCSNA